MFCTKGPWLCQAIPMKKKMKKKHPLQPPQKEVYFYNDIYIIYHSCSHVYIHEEPPRLQRKVHYYIIISSLFTFPCMCMSMKNHPFLKEKQIIIIVVYSQFLFLYVGAGSTKDLS